MSSEAMQCDCVSFCVYQCECVCVGVCVGQCTHHPESSAGKGTVHSSCVQVSWLDLFICIYLHAVKRSCCWQLPMPTVFLDPGPILSAWLHGTAKSVTAGSRPDRSASMRDSVSCRSADDNSNDLQTSASEGGMDKTLVNVGMQKRADRPPQKQIRIVLHAQSSHAEVDWCRMN